MRLAAYCWAALCVALPAFLVATSGHDPVVAHGTANGDMPPLRFRDGNVRVMVTFTDQAGIEKACGKAQPGNTMIACHKRYTFGGSELFLPNPCSRGDTEFYAKVTCHENAHAKGWSGEHEA